MSAIKRFIKQAFVANADTGLDSRLLEISRRLDMIIDQIEAHDGRLGVLQTKLGAFHEDAVQISAARAMTMALMGQSPTQSEVRAVLRLLEPMSVQDRRKIRIGSKFDGGYVMIDDFVDIDMAFSLGIESNDDWDMEMVDRSISVKQFDHSIDKAPTQHPLLHFQRLKVSDTSSETSINLEDMLADFGVKSKCILKSDIEGSEWQVLDSTSTETLDRFAQIVCEFHLLQRLGERDFFEMASRVFRKLHTTHQAVHIHGNNACPIANISNITIPTLLEVTFARRTDYQFYARDELYPTALDAPNIDGVPDIYLGAARF